MLDMCEVYIAKTLEAIQTFAMESQSHIGKDAEDMGSFDEHGQLNLVNYMVLIVFEIISLKLNLVLVLLYRLGL